MEPVQIGAREIYNEVIALRADVNADRTNHKLLEQRVTNLEKDQDKDDDKGFRAKLAVYSILAGSAAAFVTEMIGRMA